MINRLHHAPHVAMLLLNNSSVGGAERRFGQVYGNLRTRDYPISLVINESLLAGLIRAGVLAAGERPALVLKERVGRFARRWFGYLERGNTGRTDEAWRGGLERVAAALAFGLRKLDYAVACVTVGWWLIRRRPDAVHLVLGGAYVALPWQLSGLAPPAIVSVVGPPRDMVGLPVGLSLYRLSLKLARIVDALTEPIRDALLREGIPPERIRVSTGSCLDISRFRPAASKRPWVVFSGRFIPEKSPCLFVEASALVHEQIPSARFFVLGEGPLKRQVEALVKRHGLDSCTEVGWRDQVEAILAEALVFVSLQQTDNYPSQALLEAMASGAAAVATDVGLTWRLVDETVGARVEAKPDCVADAIVRLLNDAGQAAAMGARARERVTRQHSMDAYLDYLQSLYESAGRLREART